MDDLPELSIHSIEVEGRPRRSPEPVKQRLRDLSDRFFGAHAIHMREQPIPWAYRVFFRHVGLDPDVQRTPVERLALERLQHGAFRSRGLPQDALSIAIVETGVAVVAFDADRLSGEAQARGSLPGEALDDRGLDAGTLVIADADGPLAILFGEPGERAAVGRGTRRLALLAIAVNGVPPAAAEEALTIAADALRAA